MCVSTSHNKCSVFYNDSVYTKTVVLHEQLGRYIYTNYNHFILV